MSGQRTERNTYNNRFKNKLMDILTKTVDTITTNSAIRKSSILKTARSGSRNFIWRPSPLCTAPRTRPITTKAVSYGTIAY